MKVPVLQRTAVISDCGTYRYHLTRTIDERDELVMLFVMVNPSTADADVDDATIRRCLGFAQRYDFDRVEVVNLFAYRTSKPDELVAAARSGVDVTGPENLQHAKDALERANVTVLAWGVNGSRLPRNEVHELLTGSALPFFTLGSSKEGEPRHPLMVKNEQKLQLWRGW